MDACLTLWRSEPQTLYECKELALMRSFDILLSNKCCGIVFDDDIPKPLPVDFSWAKRIILTRHLASLLHLFEKHEVQSKKKTSIGGHLA